MSFRSLCHATSAAFITLVVTAGLSVGVSSASFADEQALTSDGLFTNDRGISLDGDYLELSTPYGESETQTITLTATQDLTLQAGSEYSTPGDSFYITRTGVCPGYFGTVTMKAGDSCTLTVVFTPSTPAVYYGGPSFVATVDGVKKDVGLKFQGTVETVVLSGSTDFGAVRLGESGTQQLTLTNVARYDFTPTELLTYLATYYGFSLTDTTCGGVIAAGASCTIDLQFAPIYTFDASSFSYSTGTMNGYNTYSNALSFKGSGIEGTVGLTATPSIDFGSVAEDAQASDTIVLTNTGEVRLTFNAYNGWFSDYSGAFALAGELPAALEPGESAEVPVVFSASLAAVGERLSDFNITGYTSNYTPANATVALRALVEADAVPVDPTDPPDPDVDLVDPVDPIHPVVPSKPTPPMKPEVILPEKKTVVVPPATQETTRPVADTSTGPISPAATVPTLASTGTDDSFAVVGASLLIGAGALALWLTRRVRRTS